MSKIDFLEGSKHRQMGIHAEPESLTVEERLERAQAQSIKPLQLGANTIDLDPRHLPEPERRD
jgi:hypothetical protein